MVAHSFENAKGTATPPGEGERRAQRGYGAQYQSSAAVIYAGLERGDLEWVGLADRAAGVADDLVIGVSGQVVGHQFKNSRFPETFGLEAFLLGAQGFLRPLALAWQSLKRAYPTEAVSIRLVTNNYPSTRDALVPGSLNHSAALVAELVANPGRTLAEWRATVWQPFIDRLAAVSALDETNFDQFFRNFRLIHGPAADFAQAHRLPPESTRHVREIARLLPQLVADPRDKDRWTRAELLRELGWHDSTKGRHTHQFPVGAHVQRNVETEESLRKAIREAKKGYIALVGPPGAGKSTLLQTALEAESQLMLVRYLAFVPGVGQGLGRGEADHFLDDVISQLKRTGLPGVRFRDDSLAERRQQFGALLREAGRRFAEHNVRTLIVVDGLDHVPREEKPQRSFLAELPLPSSIPEGVLFVLGTQRLDLEDLLGAVRDEAASSGRRVPMATLRREAVHRMADLLELPVEVSRDQLFELSRGHPLVTRYLIEALKDADPRRREGLLAGALPFEGDIQLVYESAWRGIEEDEEAKQVLGYIARAEGPIPLELLARAVPEHAIERALKSTKHLLTETTQGWSVFHNSFRLYVLEKPRMRLGKPDPSYSAQVYRELARLAREAPGTTPQRWLELRYLARAQEHAAVLSLAFPPRFRSQFTEGRSFDELQADIWLAFASAKPIYDPVVVFRLLLIHDELARRWSSLKDARGLIDALLAVGDVERAEALAEDMGDDGYKVVDALLSTGELDRARSLFDRLEPLQQLLTGAMREETIWDSAGTLEWARRVIHFRNPDQINQAVERIASAAAKSPRNAVVKESPEHLAAELRYEVALSIMASHPDADVEEVARSFQLETSLLAGLLVEAGLRAAIKGSRDLSMRRLRAAIAHDGFSSLPNGWRRRVALTLATSGDMQTAHAIFQGLSVPSVSVLDRQIDEAMPERVAEAVLEHAELAAMLNKSVPETTESTHAVIRPLQVHVSAIGSLLGRARVDPNLVSPGNVARAARTALAYLEQAKATEAEEHYAVIQIASATPVLGVALIQAAALCGTDEFSAVLAEFDRAFAAKNSRNSTRANLRREVAVAVYTAGGDFTEASARLEPLAESLLEDTPAMHIEALSDLAEAFARLGNTGRARELLNRIHGETLGYALAPKKDPQYATWIELLTQANAADPSRRKQRIELLMRQVNGMMNTEGHSAAYRVASPLIEEAALRDGATGLSVARALSDWGVIGWPRMVNNLLVGILKRRPELTETVVVTWCSLTLPYYMEPYYRESHLVDFVEAAVAGAAARAVGGVIQILQRAIQAEAQAHERASLLEALQQAAAKRSAKSDGLAQAVARWKAESPPPRHSYTPQKYDDVADLTELAKQLEHAEAEGINYEAQAAFRRLVGTAEFSTASAIFDRWPKIREDNTTRFALINLAIDQGNVEAARRLLAGYELSKDPYATWAGWTGGGALRYFQILARLNGEPARLTAYNHLVGALAAGRESVMSLMLEIDDVLPTIAEVPNWPAVWDCLAEQLETTREHASGKPFHSDESPGSDEETLSALYKWALRIPVSEVHRHVYVGALNLSTVPGGATVFIALVRALLSAEDDELIHGLQLLLSSSDQSLSESFVDTVVNLAEHQDFTVAEAAMVLAKRWGRPLTIEPTPLPPFYDLILDGRDEDKYEKPQLSDSESGAMRVENPMGWTAPFPELIDTLVRPRVSANHVRQRCSMLIDRWGGLEAFGQSATDRLQADLHRLDMRMRFTRPHIAVAARALRYVAGELRLAGLIQPKEVDRLLYLMGSPAPRYAVMAAVVRPTFMPRPSVDELSWRDREEKWLQGVESDTRPLNLGSDILIAEVCGFEMRKSRSTYALQRMRAPFLDVDGKNIYEWWESLPRAVWAGDSIYALDRDPAATIVRRLSTSHMPDIPQFQLTICPYWLRKLGWHAHRDNRLVFVGSSGELVARIVWWRDGNPFDIGDDVIWGEGVYASVTPEGRAQLERIASQLAVFVYARRKFTPDSREQQPQSRQAKSRD